MYQRFHKFFVYIHVALLSTQSVLQTTDIIFKSERNMNTIAHILIRTYYVYK